jgi:hypothetical protein
VLLGGAVPVTLLLQEVDQITQPRLLIELHAEMRNLLTPALASRCRRNVFQVRIITRDALIAIAEALK